VWFVQTRFETPHAVKISKRSSLVLDGNVTIQALDLDGALTVRVARGASLRIESLTVRNGGWQLVRYRSIRPNDVHVWILSLAIGSQARRWSVRAHVYMRRTPGHVSERQRRARATSRHEQSSTYCMLSGLQQDGLP
jgi:hypothetical protein